MTADRVASRARTPRPTSPLDGLHGPTEFLQTVGVLCPIEPQRVWLRLRWTPDPPHRALVAFAFPEQGFSAYGSDDTTLGRGAHDRGYLLDLGPLGTARLWRCDGHGHAAVLAEAALTAPASAHRVVDIELDEDAVVVDVGDARLAADDGTYRGGHLAVTRRIAPGVSPEGMVERSDEESPSLVPGTLSWVWLTYPPADRPRPATPAPVDAG